MILKYCSNKLIFTRCGFVMILCCVYFVQVEHVLGAVSFIGDLSVYGVEVPGWDGKAGMIALKFKDSVDCSTIDWSEFHRECTTHLPVYARPLFIRVQAGAMKMTATFKHQKNELVKDGFNPANMGNDQLYYYSYKDGNVSSLDEVMYQNIVEGKMRL